jgi:protein SCO1/2
MIRDCILPFALLVGLAVVVSPAHAQPELPPVLRSVGFDQRLDKQVPLELTFKDETGRPVRLQEYFDSKPVILVLAYYRCPMLCTEVLNGLVRALMDVSLTVGKDFNVLTVSFDPREPPALAAAKKKTYLERYGRPGAEEGWHFLTGEEGPIQRLTEAVGFRYTYDDRYDQFAHASGIMVLTPGGKISRYFYDVKYSPRDLRLGLVEASANRIGSPVDQVLLFCFHYDPAEGKYGPAVMNFVRLGGVVTLLALGWFFAAMWRQERRRARSKPASPLVVAGSPDPATGPTAGLLFRKTGDLRSGRVSRSGDLDTTG